MKKLFENLHYQWDYVVGYIMCNPHYLHRYHIFMYKKWGERYCTKKELQDYLESMNQEL
jgi:hypothetical protein